MVPDNGLTRFDGRVAPLWEHYQGVATMLFLIARIFVQLEWVDALWSYTMLIVAFPIALWLWKLDKRVNTPSVGEVSQRVPFLSVVSLLLFIGAVACFAVIDWSNWENQKIVNSVSIEGVPDV